MKRKQITVKRQIQKKIELRNQQIAFLDNKGGPKKNMSAMNERDRERIYGSGKPAINVELLTRDEMRMGKVENDEILPILEVKLPISIIITAYQTQEFIEECLDSIENQTYFINNDDYEVLIGVDGCKETLYKILQIKDKYRNISVFMMGSNMGTYVTSNTLLDLTKYDNILRFDSDDVMKPQMINEIMHFPSYDVVQFRFSDFTTNIGEYNNNFKYVAAGAHFYKKTVLDIAGGYRSWRCAADSEFIKRISKVTKIKKMEKRLFYRRGHTKSLTNRKETNLNSQIRTTYLKKIRIYNSDERIKIRKRINTYVKI